MSNIKGNLSLMIFCGKSPRHLYAANRICQAIKPISIIQEAGHKITITKVKKLLKPQIFLQKLQRSCVVKTQYPYQKEADFFFKGKTPKLDYEQLSIDVPHINHPDVVSLVEKHSPDVIAVFGTSLLKGPILEIKNIKIINLHGGITPYYRGADGTFWALYHEDFEKVGCTLHFIDAGIDTGNIIAHIFPDITPQDNEANIFWKAVSASADAYAELLTRMADFEQFGRQQWEKGQLFLVKARKIHHNKNLNRRIQKGMLKNVNLPLRIKWFAKE